MTPTTIGIWGFVQTSGPNIVICDERPSKFPTMLTGEWCGTCRAAHAKHPGWFVMS